MISKLKNNSNLPRIALIAAEGMLPIEISKTLLKNKTYHHVFGIKGFAKPKDYTNCNFTELSLGKLRILKRILKKENLTHVCLAGGIKRPKWSQLRFDVEGWLFAKQLFLHNSGDDALLKRLLKTIHDRYNLIIIPPSQIVSHWTLHKAGNLTRKEPTQSQFADIEKARKLLNLLSPFDIGQGVIILNGRILGIEDVAGTDDLIYRIRKLSLSGAILVKSSKKGQSLDIDLPAIGVKSIYNAHLAGLSGIAIESKNSFILEYQKLIDEAEKFNLFIYSLPAVN